MGAATGDDDPFYPEWGMHPDRFFQDGGLGTIASARDRPAPPLPDDVVLLTQEEFTDCIPQMEHGPPLSGASGMIAFWKAAHYQHPDPKRRRQATKNILKFADGSEIFHQNYSWYFQKSGKDLGKRSHIKLNRVDLRHRNDKDEPAWDHIAFQWHKGWIAMYLNGAIIASVKVPQLQAADSLFLLPAQIGSPDLHLRIRYITASPHRIPDGDIQSLSIIGAPSFFRYYENRLISRGLPPLDEYSVEFDRTFLFSEVPQPHQYPRLFFGEADLPAVREVLGQSERGRRLIQQCDEVIDGPVATCASLMDVVNGERGIAEVAKNPGKIDNLLGAYASFAFAHLITTLPITDQRKLILERLTINVLQELRARLDEYVQNETDNPDQSSKRGILYNHIDDLIVFDKFPCLFDLTGCWMSESARTECEEFIVQVAKGRNLLHSYDITKEPESLAEFNQEVNYNFFRRAGNRDIWKASELFLFQIMAHGLPGHDPSDIDKVLLISQVLCRQLNTDTGMMVESQGKEAHWRGFFYWMALARLTGVNFFCHPTNRRYLGAKMFVCCPFEAFSMDHGSWSRAGFSHFLKMMAAVSPHDNVEAWIARLVTPEEHEPPPKDVTKLLRNNQFQTLLPDISDLYSRDLPIPTTDHNKMDRCCVAECAPLEFSDEDIGYFVAHASYSMESTSVYLTSHDFGGGHVKKEGGHFDLAGLGTLWVTAPATFSVYNEQYSTVKIDGKFAPGVNGSECAMYCGARRSEDVVGAVIETTFSYRVSGRSCHNVNGTEISNDEPPWDDESVLVDQAFRSILFFRMGGDRALTLVFDDISMRDGETHEFGWHINIPISHSVKESETPDRFDILARGGHGDAFFATFQKEREGAQCMVKAVTPVSDLEMKDIYGYKTAGQSTPKDIYHEPVDEYSQLYSKTCTMTSVCEEYHGITALYPMEEGEAEPEIQMNGSTLTVLSSDGSREWNVDVLEREGTVKRDLVVADRFTLNL